MGENERDVSKTFAAIAKGDGVEVGALSTFRDIRNKGGLDTPRLANGKAFLFSRTAYSHRMDLLGYSSFSYWLCSNKPRLRGTGTIMSIEKCIL